MDFQTSVKTCLAKYVDFTGRASRSEYWWFFLFCLLITLVLNYINQTLAGVVSLLLFLPSLAVLVRRLHDIDRTGWWALLLLVPLIGPLILLYFAVCASTPGPNTYGG